MVKRVKPVSAKTPVKTPLKPPTANFPVRTFNAQQTIPSSLQAPITGSVAPPTRPNISLPPTWLGAFRPR